MARRSIKDIENIWSNVEGLKKLSDRVIGFGPFGVGLDGLLTWVPGIGLAYSVAASGWLIVQGVRAKASTLTLARMAAYMVVDSATDTVPLAGDVVDFFFPGQLLAAKALQKDIESTHWVEDSRANAVASGDHERHLETVRGNRKLRRIVYLHD